MATSKPTSSPRAEIGVRCVAGSPSGLRRRRDPRVAVATVFVIVVMFAIHHRHPTAEATDDPPSSAKPGPAAPTAPAPPSAAAPPLAIVDRSFIDVLKQEGVPFPSHEYVMSHGHGGL